MTLHLFSISLTSEEVAPVVKLMFAQLLTDRGSRIPKSFSSDNPPPVVSCPLQLFH
jgi:hypothetical protein